MRFNRTFQYPSEGQRPTERKALDNLTWAEIEYLAEQALRKRAQSREYWRAKHGNTTLTARS